MASDVFFADFRARSAGENKSSKIRKIFDKAGFDGLFEKKEIVAVKLHFGERGNDTFLPPVLVREVVKKILNAKGKPFLTDTNTLYTGGRKNAVDHIVTAIEHGFSYATMGAPIIIADGLKGRSVAEVEINKKRFKKVKIAADIVQAPSMVVLSHVKGHELAGFGGAIKNLAMGCAPAEGKKDQHSVRFFSDPEKCEGCGMCVHVCPTGAAQMEDGHAVIEKESCIGCGECVTVCKGKCIDIDWATDISEFMERMTEYALGAVQGKEEKTGYINFLMNITPDCDCIPWSDAPIVPDIGILASRDPVAIDQASWDLVNQQAGNPHSHLSKNLEPGAEKFQGLWGYTQGKVQMDYGEEIGMGTREYNLIPI